MSATNAATSIALLEPMNQPAFQICLQAFYNCSNQALIRVQASEDATTAHVPSTVFLVLDISLSMGAAASMHDDSDGASGLSQLDIVKHAARAIIESLHEQDQLAVVAFASHVETVFNLAPMTAENRRSAWRAVDALYPTSSTNLYGGLIQALNLIKEQQVMPSNPNIMLLTDGMPNVTPPRGELQSLTNYLDANPELNQVRISTFGFGYQLKSQLLADIATLGRSMYAFIPDSSFVGTVFVNAVANILASASTSQLTLKLKATEDSVKLKGIKSGQTCTVTNWGLQVELPSLLYGQTLEVLVDYETRHQLKEPFQVFLETNAFEKHLDVYPRYIDEMDPEDTIFARAQVRSQIIQAIREAGRCSTKEELETAREVVQLAQERVASWADKANSPDIARMKQDLDGQISEAYSRLDWHRRWGIHYTLSLASAHSLLQCTNFKDPGLETYATAKFSMIRDECEAKFVDLPPPKPSREVRRAVSSMKTYYCSSNPCFGSGFVQLADGRLKSITDVTAGDSIQSANGPVCVRCVVETPIPSGTAGLVRLDGLVTVTPWHPICPIGGQIAWTFPHKLNTPQSVPCDRIFSLVLEEGGKSFRIGNYEAVALGHGIVGDPIASHEYLGTDLVVKDLATMEGWENGHVVLPHDPVVRSPTTSLIVGFKSTSEVRLG